MHEEPPSPGRRYPLAFWLLLATVLLAIIGWQSFHRLGTGRDGAAHPAVGRKIEFLRLEPLTGKASQLSLEDLQGKVTLINFWGPWCGPCRIEFPELYELRQSYRNRSGVRFVSVSCSGVEGAEDNGDQEREETEAFLREQKADMPVHYDPFYKSRRALVETAGLEQFVYPTTVIIDSSGTIRGLWTGYSPGDELKMHALLESLVQGSSKKEKG